jgi:hypothetical protein
VTEVMKATGEFNAFRIDTIYDQLVHRGYATPRNDGSHVGTKRGPFGGVRVRVIELSRTLFADVRIGAATRDPDADLGSEEIEKILRSGASADESDAAHPALPN